jgi:hypothetical protein
MVYTSFLKTVSVAKLYRRASALAWNQSYIPGVLIGLTDVC